MDGANNKTEMLSFGCYKGREKVYRRKIKKRNKRIKILLIYPTYSTHVRRDLAILGKNFAVIPFQWRGKKDVIRLIYNISNSDITFSWFAGDHAAIAVLFSNLLGKKSVIITGGGDIAYVPEINYGRFCECNTLQIMMTKYAVNNASLVIAFSKSSLQDLLKRLKPKKYTYVYLGIPAENVDLNTLKKERLVITVGHVKRDNLKRKGLEYFVRVAKQVPEANFVVIGRHIDDAINYLKKIAPPNVKFTGFVDDDELKNWYKRAKVYVQLSAHEGFGVSVGEAMLYGCVPVVTDRYSLPEVVGDCGFYVKYGDVDGSAKAVMKALDASPERMKKCRRRVLENFTLEKRRKGLIKVLKELIE